MSLFDDLDRLPGRLLVASDFDGTLAELGIDPDATVAVVGALEALRQLTARPDVEVAVVSGRSMADLVRMVPLDGVTLVGEHGAAWQGEHPAAPDGFDRVRAVLEEVAASHPGSRVEVKAASLVVHTRGMEPRQEIEALGSAVEALHSLGHDNLHIGKHIVDVGFVEISKGLVVERLRHSLGCRHVVFAGDDTTDETVFERLRPRDVGIKVGPGPTSARHRVASPTDVVAILQYLAGRAFRPDTATAPAG
ncbi:MAG: trehalose-phosphatase [Acidimicrobiia bacterium]